MNRQKFYDSDPAKAFYSNLFAELGDGRSQFGLSAVFALYGWTANDKKALKVASQIAEAVLASGTVVQVLKHSTGRESPIVRSSPTGTWRFLPSPFDYHQRIPAYDAYPSGHVATSLATVIVLAENYPDVKWIRPVGYTLVAGVAVGMVNSGIHWYSDYPLSIALGYYFGMIVAHPDGIAFENDDKAVQISLIPIARPEGAGLSLLMTF
jgi:membrane-associated phospholipid phosphatase